MAVDVVSELRAMQGGLAPDRTYVMDLFRRAADEIERLRADLEEAQAEA